jgi:hypothetical protein
MNQQQIQQMQNLFAQFTGQNVNTALAELRKLFPTYEIYPLDQYAITTCEFKSDRMTVFHDLNNNVTRVRLG